MRSPRISARALRAPAPRAPGGWTSPVVGEGDPERFAAVLAHPDVWFLVAVSDGEVIGDIAPSLSTGEDPGPPPPGALFVWQLFLRPAWHGRGVATDLMRAAVAEAARRGFSRMRLWTPEGPVGRGGSMSARFGRSPVVPPRSAFGLPTIEYGRSIA